MRHKSHAVPTLQFKASRPQRGLALLYAFDRWAKPEDAARARECSDANVLFLWIPGATPSQYELRYYEYERAEIACMAALLPKLLTGEVLASAISGLDEDDPRRKIIRPSMWDILRIVAHQDRIVGEDRVFLKPEFFSLQEIPQNVGKPPAWVNDLIEDMAPEVSLRFDSTYTHCYIGDRVITAGLKQSQALRELHQSLVRGEPWCNGKSLLGRIGSSSEHFMELFKHKKWRQIIESDGGGKYRLIGI